MPFVGPGAAESTATQALSPGTVLGKYQLLRRLALGGMAELYLARVAGLQGFEKLVALKRILPPQVENEDYVAMFLDEARLAATLHHVNIAQVYDIGVAAGSYFFTMEFVEGVDVARLMRTLTRAARGLPLEHALGIVIGTCAGLHHAHDKRDPTGRPLNIVHRDVSPSNVLVAYDGAVKLVDFGIAKAAGQSHATRGSTLKGKIAYMSPEQCRGRPLDRRSDVFACGILLHELTTGRRLFRGENEFAVMNLIADRDAPAPSTWVKDYPPELERIVMRAMARDREARYATAEDLQVDLEDFARRRQLAVSSLALGRFMRDLFADKVQAMSEARQLGRLVELLSEEGGAPGGHELSQAPAPDDTTGEVDPVAIDATATIVSERSRTLPSIPPLSNTWKVDMWRRWSKPLGKTVVGAGLALALAGVGMTWLGRTASSAGGPLPSPAASGPALGEAPPAQPPWQPEETVRPVPRPVETPLDPPAASLASSPPPDEAAGSERRVKSKPRPKAWDPDSLEQP
jgi:serine/threonine protein kinase